MEKYIGSMLAFKGDKFFHCVAILRARSKDEATGKGLRLCRQHYPESEGYLNHSVSFVNERDFEEKQAP